MQRLLLFNGGSRKPPEGSSHTPSRSRSSTACPRTLHEARMRSAGLQVHQLQGRYYASRTLASVLPILLYLRPRLGELPRKRDDGECPHRNQNCGTVSNTRLTFLSEIPSWFEKYGSFKTMLIIINRDDPKRWLGDVSTEDVRKRIMRKAAPETFEKVLRKKKQIVFLGDHRH